MVIRRLVILVCGSLGFWVLAAALAYLVWEDHRDLLLGYSATAFLLCLLPAVATMLWAHWALNQSPEHQLATILGGTGVRMFFVLGVGLLLTSQVAYFQRQGFWMWLLVFYLVILTLEMILVAGSRSKAGQQEATK